jgi:hypothetical protein
MANGIDVGDWSWRGADGGGRTTHEFSSDAIVDAFTGWQWS